MGINYIVANLTRRQFFDPDDVGGSENTKWPGILRGDSAHALAHLLTLDHRLEYHLTHWVGDQFFLVGDTDSCVVPRELVHLAVSDDESPYETVKSQFSDISLNLIAEICARAEMLEKFIELASRNTTVFVNLAHIVLYLDAPAIQSSFVARFGTDWRKRYNEITKEKPWHSPRPMLPGEANPG